MTPEGLAGTGIGGRTPLTGWGGVQIENLGRNGRHLRTGRRPDLGCMADWTPVGCWRGVQIGVVWRIGRLFGIGAASRFGLYGGLDATYGLARRPDSWWLLIWTPVGCWRGVQIGDVWRIGRLLCVGAASRFGLYGGLDAT